MSGLQHVRVKRGHLKQLPESRSLEMENKRLEKRLAELRLQMSQEKEQRELFASSNGHWQSSQAKQSPTSEGKSAKSSKLRGTATQQTIQLKFLRDEPINVPQQQTSKLLATAKKATMAEQLNSLGNSRHHGPERVHCGQCEHGSASKSCVECGENYCSDCFSQFHQRGALRRHRAKPLQVLQPSAADNLMTSPSSFQNNQTPTKSSQALQTSSTPQSSRLLHGTYDEAASSASFQEALNEWRQQPKLVTSTTVQSESDNDQAGGADKQIMSKEETKSPLAPVSSTMTETDSSCHERSSILQMLEQHIPSGSQLSYADRLLLQRLRLSQDEHCNRESQSRPRQACSNQQSASVQLEKVSPTSSSDDQSEQGGQLLVEGKPVTIAAGNNDFYNRPPSPGDSWQDDILSALLSRPVSRIEQIDGFLPREADTSGDVENNLMELDPSQSPSLCSVERKEPQGCLHAKDSQLETCEQPHIKVQAWAPTRPYTSLGSYFLTGVERAPSEEDHVSSSSRKDGMTTEPNSLSTSCLAGPASMWLPAASIVGLPKSDGESTLSACINDQRREDDESDDDVILADYEDDTAGCNNEEEDVQTLTDLTRELATATGWTTASPRDKADSDDDDARSILDRLSSATGMLTTDAAGFEVQLDNMLTEALRSSPNINS